MNAVVTTRREGAIAVVAIDNPPVNALSTPVKRALLAAFAALERDPAVKGVVLSAAGHTFAAGADIGEMDRAPEPPFLPEVVAAIDACTKPTAAALFGNVLGGGLELALACRLRVADAATRLGFPEVKLGLAPGAGGTQRLMRRTDFATAVRLVTTGKSIGAEEASGLGLIDRIADEDVTRAAIAALSDAIARDAIPKSTAAGASAAPAAAHLQALRAEVRKTARGQQAPLKALEVMAATAGKPLVEGLAAERALFLDLRASVESRALRYLFLAERDAGRLPEIAGVEPRPIRHIGVVGAGLMGCGIGFAAAASGCRVTFIDSNDEAVERGKARIEELFAASLRSGRLSPDACAKRNAQFAFSTEVGALADADLVIEAIFENMDAKRAVFAKLDAIVRPNAILASNTSYLDIDEIAAATKDPSRVVGLHFFSPAHVMRLCEVVRGAETDADVLATAVAVARKLGKIPVVTRVCEGFCGNRILRRYRLVAEAMLEDGALPDEIDAAMTAYGFAMGPFAVQDMSGLEIAYANRKLTPPIVDGRRMVLVERLVEADRLGRKNGKGWYLYSDGAREGVPDPDVANIIAAASAEKGIARRAFSRDEITQRLIRAIQDEGQRVLDEGVVSRAADVDLVLVHGYGFPSYKGGPMFARANSLT